MALEKTIFCVSAVRGYAPPLQTYREARDGRENKMWMASVTSEGIEFSGLWKFSQEEARCSALRTWLDAHNHDGQIFETFERQRYLTSVDRGKSKGPGPSAPPGGDGPPHGRPVPLPHGPGPPHGLGPPPHGLPPHGPSPPHGPLPPHGPPPPLLSRGAGRRSLPTSHMMAPPPQAPNHGTEYPGDYDFPSTPPEQMARARGVDPMQLTLPSMLPPAPGRPLCKDFLIGRCRQMFRCRYSHAMPEALVDRPIGGDVGELRTGPPAGPPGGAGGPPGPLGPPAPPAAFGVLAPPSFFVSPEPIIIPLTTTQRSGMSLDKLIEIRRTSRAKIELKTERPGGAGLSSSSIKISGSLRAVELAMPMVQSMLATAEETWSRAQAQLAGGARSSRTSDEDAADETSDRAAGTDSMEEGQDDYAPTEEAHTPAQAPARDAPHAAPAQSRSGSWFSTVGEAVTWSLEAAPYDGGATQALDAAAPSDERWGARNGVTSISCSLGAMKIRPQEGSDPSVPTSAIADVASSPASAAATMLPQHPRRRNMPCPCVSGKLYRHCCEKVISRELLSGLHVSRQEPYEGRGSGAGGRGAGGAVGGRADDASLAEIVAAAPFPPRAARWGIGAPIVAIRDREGMGGAGASACVVCNKAPTDHAFVPCGHLCLCVDCGGNYLSAPQDHPWRLSGCPVCCTPYQTVMRIYKAGATARA